MRDLNILGQAHEKTKGGCSLTEFTDILDEISNQSPWRGQADKESDYIDGNQLDSAALATQEDKGIPPSIENLMGVEIEIAYGRAANNKKDAKVQVENEGQGEEVAEALNAKLHKVEKTSGADKSCLLAHKKQIGVGIGWVEVSRQADPFKPPYKTQEINRNEIWWDMSATEPDLSDAQWLLRRRWTFLDIAISKFPGKKDVIYNAGTGWQTYDYATELDEGGTETGLYQSRDIERGWSVEDQEWRDIDRKRICIFEVLTRHYCTILVMKTPDGRVLKFDIKNPVHQQAVAMGMPLEKANISEIYKSYYVGPHLLAEEKLDCASGKFNYVPFFYHREDRNGIPFGKARGMMSLQDEHNARISSMIWGLGSVRTIRTEGAVKMTDKVFRDTIARRDADIVLDKEFMGNGGMFKVERDYELNSQQYQRMQDIREGIERQSMMTGAYRGGSNNSADSASGLKLELDQSNQTTSGLNENYEYSRKQVLDLLLWFLIEDSQDEEEVFIDGGLIKDDRVVTINQPAVDEATGQQYKNNDVQRVRLTVALSDIPSNPSLAQQELMSITEFAKASMPEIQTVLAPHIANLSSIPNKKEIVDAIREIIKAPSQEETDRQIEEAVDACRVKFQHDLKTRELDIKETKTDAEIQKLVADAVNSSLTAFYSATQAGLQINAAPAIAPLADELLQSAGFEDQNAPPIIGGGVPVPAKVDPNLVMNTSPQSPPVVQTPDIPEQVPGMPAGAKSPAVGAGNGIETQGVSV